MKKTIVIVVVHQMIYITKIIAKILGPHFNVLTIDNTLFNSQFEKFKHADMFVVYCIFRIDPNLISKMNKRLIIYQLEQHVNKKISRHYDRMLADGSFFAFYNTTLLNLEYCQQNMDVMSALFGIQTRMLPIPIDLLCKSISTKNKVTDILFVGCMNDRRMSILHDLSKSFTVNCITKSVFDVDLIPYFSQCKLLLNIHYYENAILERVRINEALHHGMVVVSEKPNALDNAAMDYYGDTVTFVNSAHELTNVIKHVLKTYDADNHIKKLEQMLTRLNAHFKNDLMAIFKDQM